MKESTKRAFLVGAILFSLVPTLLLVAWPSTATVNSVTLWFADTLGYVGITLLLWMYILGAKSVMGVIFKDLAPVLSIHKWLGKYGVLAIFAHPLLVTFSFGESLMYSFIPHIGTLYERHVTLGRISFWVLLLTWVVSAFLRDRMAFRPWKYLHYLAYLCVPFALLHIPNVGSHYMSSVAVKTYFFTLIVVFVIITVARLRGVLNLDKAAYTVISQAKLTDTDYALYLKPKFSSRLAPKRGQYVYVKLGFVSEDHPFSVLQYEPSTHNLTVGYRVFGDYTNIMSKLTAGETVYVGGPYGSFMANYEADERPAVFLTGGIGITPFVDQIIQNHDRKEQWLFAANRTRSIAVLVPELAPYLRGKLVRVYSRETSPLQPDEEAGHITARMLKKYLGELNKYSFYLCGPPPMMDAMKDLLQVCDVPKTQVHSETFGW